jgi:hypothetical protein
MPRTHALPALPSGVRARYQFHALRQALRGVRTSALSDPCAEAVSERRAYERIANTKPPSALRLRFTS